MQSPELWGQLKPLVKTGGSRVNQASVNAPSRGGTGRAAACGMDPRQTNGNGTKGRQSAGTSRHANAELKHDIDLLLENLYREIDRINRRLDRLERKADGR